MSELGTELSQQLRDALRLQGGPPNLRLSTEIIPVINAFTLDDTPWHGRHSFAFTMGTAGAVGASSYLEFGLRIDAPASAKLVLRRIVVTPNSAGSFFILSFSHGVANSGSANPASVWESDQSNAATAVAAPMTAAVGTTAGGDFNGVARVWAPNLANTEVLGPLTLGKGQIAQLRSVTQNLECYFSVQGDIYGL